MTGVETIHLIDEMKGLWSKWEPTHQQIGVYSSGLKPYVYDKALNVINDCFRDVDSYGKPPEKEIFKRLRKLPRPAPPITPVYALSATGHHFTNNYTTPDYNYAERLMRGDLVDVIKTYGWDDEPVDFTTYADFDQFLKDRAPLIANNKLAVQKGDIRDNCKPIPKPKDLGTELANQKQKLYDESSPEEKKKLAGFGYNAAKLAVNS